MNHTDIVAVTKLSCAKKPTFVCVGFYNSWWNIGDANGTLEAWVKKPSEDLAVLEDEMQEILNSLDG